MVISNYESTSPRESQRIKDEIDKLDAERAAADQALLDYLRKLREALDQRYGDL